MPDPDIPPGHKFLRCFCSVQPILAVYGIDRYGQTFVHIKIWKQRRVFGEVVFRGGQVKIFCRECTRWHVITMRPNQTLQMTETEKPSELEAGIFPPATVVSDTTWIK